MKKVSLVLAFALTLVWPNLVLAQTKTPVKLENTSAYSRADGEFASAVVIDARSGEVLYEYQADKKWSAASLTKLMNALVFLENRPNWNKVVSILKSDEVGGGRLRVASGATLTAMDLLYSSITSSANNAATAMARVTRLGYAGFVKAMNIKAKSMGLTKTTFVDPSGMSEKNVTTAREMAKIAMTAFDVDVIRRAATTAQYKFVIRNTGEAKTIKTTNDLLVARNYDDIFVTGGKTGFIYESMYNLAVRVKPTSDKGSDRMLMVVVFGSPTREASFASANSLANWAWKVYKW